LLTLLQKYLEFTGNSNEQQKWLNQFTWELARHSIGEELVVYPSFESKLGVEGKAIADQDRKEHQTAKDLLYQLQSMNAG
jgi:iron-sulfur cluster repair protein YtfE (RIC family)